jgi:hypothetical protein
MKTEILEDTNKTTDTDQTIFEAIKWVSNGYAVIPCRPQDKRPALSRWGRFQTELPRVSDLINWFVEGESNHYNLAVITGWNHLVAIDFDDLAKYLEWREFIEVHNPDAINTYQVMTGRGVHVYYRIEKPVLNQKLNKIDIKSRGGYVLAPPSIHPSGDPYWAFSDLPVMQAVSIKDVLPSHWLGQRETSRLHSVREITQTNAHLKKPDLEKLKGKCPDHKHSDPWAIADQPGQSEDVITRIRNRISILDYFPDAIKTRKDFYLARCPFHDDHNPSFWINTELRICNCYKCQFTPVFDVINLHAALNNLTNAGAIKDLGRLLIK